MGSMSASDAAPLPRLGEVFFDVRGDSRTMRVSWYADTGVAVFSIWQGDTCTGTFRLPIPELPRMVEALSQGPPGRHQDLPSRDGYGAATDGYGDARPDGYQDVPSGGYAASPAYGYQAVPPDGYQAVPPDSYQGVPPGGYQDGPSGEYAGSSAYGYQAAPPDGYQAAPP